MSDQRRDDDASELKRKVKATRKPIVNGSLDGEALLSERVLPSVLAMLPSHITMSGNSDLSVTVNVALLPPAEEFAKYENTMPGAAMHIVAAADEQRAHRHRLELMLVEGNERRRDRGQLLSAGVCLAGITGAVALGIAGSPWVAAVVAVVSVGGPLAAQQLAQSLARSQREGARTPAATVPSHHQGNGTSDEHKRGDPDHAA